MDGLVARLANGRHSLIPARAKSIQDLKESVDRGFVLVKFTDTQGGTELGIELDRKRSIIDEADFLQGRGLIRLVGRLALNDETVELSADIDLSTLRGQGNLAYVHETDEL